MVHDGRGGIVVGPAGLQLEQSSFGFEETTTVWCVLTFKLSPHICCLMTNGVTEFDALFSVTTEAGHAKCFERFCYFPSIFLFSSFTQP